MAQLPTKRRFYTIAFGLGILLFLLTHIFDLLFYPALGAEMLTVRIAVALLLALGIALLFLLDQRWHDPVAATLAVCSGLSVTVLAVLSGEGFASPVYAGHFLIIMVSSLLFYLDNRLYISAMLLLMIQHFAILSFFPAEEKYIVLQFLALVPSVLVGMLTHQVIYSFFIKTRTLENFLPICANCKKIRDDKGYWNQIESYIRHNFGKEFSHGMCPECIQQVYGWTVDDQGHIHKN